MVSTILIHSYKVQNLTKVTILVKEVYIGSETLKGNKLLSHSLDYFMTFQIRSREG